jgi:tetratricopeptide (TPR) repeat protein
MAFRFKHMLIREVAYAGLSKQSRAQQHARFAEWLKERAGEELLEIRAHHLDHATQLLTELDGAPPADLTSEAADALTRAGKRALNREQYKSARSKLARAVELEPTLQRRYYAARAVWRLGDLTAVTVEMEKVRAEAAAEGNALMEALALTALGDAVLRQSGDTARAQELIDRALELQKNETDVDAHFDSLLVRVGIAGMRGSMTEAVPYIEQAFAVALAAGRKDLQTIASQALAQAHIVRLELDKAERLIQKAVELADESGSPRARGQALLTLGLLHRMRKEFEAAEGAYELARELFAEIGNATLLSYSLSSMADVAFEKGELKRAEKLLRESIRLLAPLGQHRELAEAQADLARVLAEQGKIDEAERFVAEAQEYLPSAEPQLRLFIVLAEAAVRAAQEQEEEAEALLVEALTISDEIDFKAHQAEVLQRIIRFLGDCGQDGKAAPYEERLAALVPAESTAEIA